MFIRFCIHVFLHFTTTTANTSRTYKGDHRTMRGFVYIVKLSLNQGQVKTGKTRTRAIKTDQAIL
ncbi:MAG: hypothetical protein B6230_04885 [Desulfobacteraceae bacterium 4572_89]|nr:MAG: hypothetical protein B6230_04885 [Desulfobacteraceae bacterium 4572_89]